MTAAITIVLVSSVLVSVINPTSTMFYKKLLGHYSEIIPGDLKLD
jgi:hypothetical protein